MTLCLVSLGSNLGDREAIVTDAIHAISRFPGVSDFRKSSLHKTSPVGGPPGQAQYVNAVVGFDYSGSAHDLMGLLESLERGQRRTRVVRWSPRTLDLDLLAFGQEVIDEPNLRVPHPRMSFRPFVITPAEEAAPDWVHPELGCTIQWLSNVLRHGEDAIEVIGPQSGPIAALLGAERSIRIAAGAYNTASGHPAPQIVRTLHAERGTAKLCVDTDPLGASTISGPTLRLADSPPETWRVELLAACDAIWPPEHPQASNRTS